MAKKYKAIKPAGRSIDTSYYYAHSILKYEYATLFLLLKYLYSHIQI